MLTMADPGCVTTSPEGFLRDWSNIFSKSASPQYKAPLNQFEAVKSGPQPMGDFVKSGGKLTTSELFEGQLVTICVCEGGPEIITAFHDLGGKFDNRQDIHGKTAGMAAAAHGDTTMEAFVKAGGIFSNKIRDCFGRTEAFYVPLKCIPTFIRLGGTFFDVEGHILKDNSGIPVYADRASNNPEAYRNAIVDGLFNRAAEAVNASAHIKQPFIKRLKMAIVLGL